ncbi:hypothetical protein EMPS_05168 [Entomortierella parvispora]|uniref:F-box domain-containing protein n=1 Tax=Entomortierella parvispora TaxID=205924 RepID=A0A9P3H9X5_9FUNG|nr:hypothetical protein EMPS_05168 [Entomortierella parvispora]
MPFFLGSCEQQEHIRPYPLELPEIVMVVGKYLSPTDVTTCLRVCHLWYHVLVPRIWSNIEFLNSGASRLPLRIGPAYSSLVRRVYVQNHDRGEVFFPNLNNLVLSRVLDGSKATADMVHRHRHTLMGLSTEQSLSTEFLDAIIGCQKLRVLYAWKAPLPECSDQLTRMYEKVWSRLDTLGLAGPWFDQASSITDLMNQSLPSSNIQELTIVGTSFDSTHVQDCHLWLIKRCNLIHLRWFTGSPGSDRERGPMYFLARELRQSADCRWMRRLEFLDLPQQSFQLKDFSKVVEWIPRLVGLCLPGSEFGLDAWTTLKGLSPRHLTTLRVLKLHNCKNLPGPAIQSILCSMPKLEVFKGYEIWTSDILAEDNPWVCRDLKKLRLRFIFAGPIPTQAMVLSRLSELVKLESLNMYMSGELLFTLSAGEVGLDSLRTLGRLRSFVGGFSGWESVWGEAEARWVQVNWPKLQKLVQVDMTDETKDILENDCKIKIVERYSDD